MNSDKLKKSIEMQNSFVGKYYDLEVMKSKSYLNFVTMSPHDLKDVHLVKYDNAQLININGLGTGQVHFVTKNGEYLLLPWCYVVSMIPSKEGE